MLRQLGSFYSSIDGSFVGQHVERTHSFAAKKETCHINRPNQGILPGHFPQKLHFAAANCTPTILSNLPETGGVGKRSGLVLTVRVVERFCLRFGCFRVSFLGLVPLPSEQRQHQFFE